MKTKSNGSRKKLPPVWAKKVERLEEVVAHEFGHELDELWKPTRNITSVWARWVIWHYMTKWNIRLNQILRHCGFSQTSPSYGSVKLRDELTHSAELQEMFLNVANELNTPSETTE